MLSHWFNLTPKHLLYDRTLVWLSVALASIGFIMIASASIAEGDRLYQSPFFFVIRQVANLGVAFFALCCMLLIPIRRLEKSSNYLLGFAILLLVLVLIPGIGHSVNGARRWISAGLFNFQPVEFVKFACICYMASYFVRRYESVREKNLSAVKPALVLVFLSLFILMQPDLGSTVVLCFVTFTMLFLVGAKVWQFIGLAILGIAGIFGLIFTSKYRIQRLMSFTDPFADPYGSGYQLSNSLMAYGRGELLGNGLGNSVQKLYIPEPHTDFIMAILGEELGLVGVFGLIVLFGLFLLRLLKIGKAALLEESHFAGYFTFGTAAWFFFQGVYNLGMTLAVFPVKGFTFPFVSYGGSSLLMNAIALAVVLRIDYEYRVKQNQAHPKREY